MKLKVIFLTLALIISFSGNLFAGCGSCETAGKAADTCTDGVCAPTEKAGEHKHADHKHDEKKVEETKAETVASVNSSALKSLIDSGVPLVILDARSGKYDDGKRLPGALSLNSESKPEEVAKVLPNKEALIVTYCSNLKCPASHKLFEHLKSLGYTNLIEYPEGIQGWIEAGNPVKSSK